MKLMTRGSSRVIFFVAARPAFNVGFIADSSTRIISEPHSGVIMPAGEPRELDRKTEARSERRRGAGRGRGAHRTARRHLPRAYARNSRHDHLDRGASP